MRTPVIHRELAPTHASEPTEESARSGWSGVGTARVSARAPINFRIEDAARRGRLGRVNRRDKESIIKVSEVSFRARGGRGAKRRCCRAPPLTPARRLVIVARFRSLNCGW